MQTINLKNTKFSIDEYRDFWKDKVLQNCRDIPIVVIGNKTDLHSARVVNDTSVINISCKIDKDLLVVLTKIMEKIE